MPFRPGHRRWAQSAATTLVQDAEDQLFCTVVHPVCGAKNGRSVHQVVVAYGCPQKVLRFPGGVGYQVPPVHGQSETWCLFVTIRDAQIITGGFQSLGPQWVTPGIARLFCGCLVALDAARVHMFKLQNPVDTSESFTDWFYSTFFFQILVDNCTSFCGQSCFSWIDLIRSIPDASWMHSHQHFSIQTFLTSTGMHQFDEFPGIETSDSPRLQQKHGPPALRRRPHWIEFLLRMQQLGGNSSAPGLVVGATHWSAAERHGSTNHRGWSCWWSRYSDHLCLWESQSCESNGKAWIFEAPVIKDAQQLSPAYTICWK